MKKHGLSHIAGRYNLFLEQFGMSMRTTKYKIWSTNKDLLYSIRNYIQYPVITYNGKGSKYKYTNQSLRYTPKTNTTLYSNYT